MLRKIRELPSFGVARLFIIRVQKMRAKIFFLCLVLLAERMSSVEPCGRKNKMRANTRIFDNCLFVVFCFLPGIHGFSLCLSVSCLAKASCFADFAKPQPLFVFREYVQSIRGVKDTNLWSS